MSMLLAWIVYPLVLALLCGGLGLLVDLLAGRSLPGALVIPVGFAAMVVVGEFTTALEATAPLTVPLVVFLAVAGAGLSWPWRFKTDPLPAAVAVAVFAVFAAPAVLSGDPTFGGFIKLDDTATWLAMTDRVMEHGRSLSGLDLSSYRATLDFNLAGGYPIGVFVPFGTAGALVGGDLAWVFQPYLSFLAALLALSLWQLFGGFVQRRPARAAAAFIAAQPTLLYGYAMWGGVKEVAAAALVALAAALAPGALEPGGALRRIFPLALTAAAIVGVLSAGGVLWVGPMLLLVALLVYRRLGLREAGLRALAFVALLVVLTIPSITSGLVPPTSKPLVGSDGEGNLLGALNPLQAIGIWPAGDFRVDPDGTVATAVLLALAACTILISLWALWRRRGLAPLLYASALATCAAIVIFGSPWAGGKALATASPALLSLAVLGAVAAMRLDRITGWVLAIVLAGGVLWSNVLAYGGADLAPYGQLRDLEWIGERFAGEGPALMTEYNPYGARHFLRNLDGEGASELRNRTVPLRAGGEAKKGEAVDTDEIEPSALFTYRTLVLRRSPVRSRPPAPYRLVWEGRYYEVWQRPEGETAPLGVQLPLGTREAPAAVPSCPVVLDLAAEPIDGVEAWLLAARHAPVFEVSDGTFTVPRAGEYAGWVKGSFRGEARLLVDGREVGSARHQLQNEGGFVELGRVLLAPGRHSAELKLGGADLHPGSGGFPRPPIERLLFAPSGEERGELVSVPAAAARQLCGKPWDWIQAVPARGR
ncbi:MAG TPA: hypothetical protein VFU11_09735 [Solirubrobacterales bacterium]|nr:hypothetical protein [Solirubrobacterales bacterium]